VGESGDWYSPSLGRGKSVESKAPLGGSGVTTRKKTNEKKGLTLMGAYFLSAGDPAEEGKSGRGKTWPTNR